MVIMMLVMVMVMVVMISYNSIFSLSRAGWTSFRLMSSQMRTEELSSNPSSSSFSSTMCTRPMAHSYIQWWWWQYNMYASLKMGAIGLDPPAQKTVWQSSQLKQKLSWCPILNGLHSVQCVRSECCTVTIVQWSLALQCNHCTVIVVVFSAALIPQVSPRRFL